MASITDVSTPIIDWNFNSQSVAETKTDVDFSDILNKLKNASDKTTDTVKLTDNAKTEAALKKIIWDIMQNGVDEAKATIDALSDDDKAEVIEILQMIIDTVAGEINGDKPNGTIQELMNSLFTASDEESDASDLLSAQQTLALLQLSIAKLKDEDTTSSEVLSQLLPLLVSLNETTVSNGDNSEDNTVEAVDGYVGVKTGNTTYTMTLENFQETIQDFVDVLNGVIPEVTTPVDETEETPADETVITPTDGTVTDPTDGTETTPTDGTNNITTENPIMLESESLSAPILQTAKISTYKTIEANNSNALNKLLSESNLVRTAVLSQRVLEKTDELELLDISGITGNAAQGVLQTPFKASDADLNQMPLETQIIDNLSYQLQNSKDDTTSEMSIKLSPENLGEISIRLVNKAGEITVTIAAQSEITQKLLQEKLPSLISNLQNINNEVKDVRVVQGNENASLTGFNLNNSGNEQSGNNNYSNTGTNNIYTTGSVQTVKETSDTESVSAFKGGSKLWQTA